MTARSANPTGSILGEIHLGLFTPLFIHTALIHVAIVLARVTTSYAAVDLDMSFIEVGVIASAFSILPVFIAVPLGRVIDRGHDSLSVRLGSLGLVASGLIYWLAPTNAWTLFAATAALGLGQIGCMAGHQMISIRAGKTVRGRDAVFGYHMVAIACGQALGPLIIGWFAGGARVPPVHLLFGVTLLFAVFAQAASFALPAAPVSAGKKHEGPAMKLMDLAKIRGLVAYIMASVMTITALDLVVIYLPLLGAERHIDAATIGLMMSVRAVCSMLARLLYVPMMELMGRMTLTYLAMASPALAFLVVAAPVPLWLIYPAIAVAGLGLGVSATLTLSGLVDRAPLQARATAMSLRLTGNRLGMIVIPMAASLVATAAGAAGVFVILAGTLSGSAISIWWSRRAED